jgi:phosphohistidine phosphatase
VPETEAAQTPPTRRLVVMRHAKAEAWGESDQGRTLEPRGHDDAADAGRWLAELGFVPDHALVSAAVRARETWEAVAEAAGWDVDPVLEPGLYAAGPEAALDLIREVPEHATDVIVIGHNPTIAYLAQLLDDGAGDAEAGAAMVAGYPTSALTVLELAGTWVELDMASASVVAFHVGRAATSEG